MIMKLRLVALLCLTLITVSYGQVGINTIEPDASAILDISSTNQGVLFPRMDLQDLSEAAPVTNPEKSLMVWNTDANNGGVAEGFYYWDGMRWKPFCDENSELSGVFGELRINADSRFFLNRNNETNIFSGSTGTASGVRLNSGNFSMTPQVEGLYEVKYTISYQKNSAAGSNQIEFFFAENTNAIGASRTTGTLSTNKESVTITVRLNLRNDQTYSLGISRSNNALDNTPTEITIFNDLTQFSIERL